jgi:beta-glucosidase
MAYKTKVSVQQTKRFTINAKVSEKALREIYLKPFEIAIKEAKPWALMTSYNSINGKHADMSEFLLQKILRQEWGWEGRVDTMPWNMLLEANQV